MFIALPGITMARHHASSHIDTVIVGSGPSALILSYILHGHIPKYDVDSPHPDPILDAKLRQYADLLSADVDHLTEHFYGSRFPYSTQALPINVLLDTLIRPYGETDQTERKTCIKWHYDSSRIVPHVVIGSASDTGGQWVDNPVKASWDIGALSYAGMLSLPGFSFEQYYAKIHGEAAPFFLRPTRRDVAGYLATYPHEVGISEAILTGVTASQICRRGGAFYIGSQDLTCDHLVLASGTFTQLVPPRLFLQPLVRLNERPNLEKAILVVGSGFSAADIILSASPSQKIIHIFKWDPKANPSPLKACHAQAYPEYAGVYKKMKAAAMSLSKSKLRSRPATLRRTSELDTLRDWDTSYEGLPNTAIVDVNVIDDHAVVVLQNRGGETFQKEIGIFAYVVGRHGTLEYLQEDLRKEICPDKFQWGNVNGQTLRAKASEDLEIAPQAFVIGSLTGDSLIRFGYGACAYAAGKIIAARQSVDSNKNRACSWKSTPSSRNNHIHLPAMKGLQGHGQQYISGMELQLDRRKSEICVE